MYTIFCIKIIVLLAAIRNMKICKYFIEKNVLADVS